MAKLYFKYSTMNAGKSIDLIRSNFNYNENDKKTVCLTSGMDDRYGKNKIASRIGVSVDAISVYEDTNIYELIYKMEDISCVLVDEVQFFKKHHIYELADVVDRLDIPVIAYGLRSDFTLEKFEGSSYMFILADNIEEIRTLCNCCKKKKAIVNARFENDKLVTEGEQVQIGGNESYKPLCRKCYKKIIENNGKT